MNIRVVNINYILKYFYQTKSEKKAHHQLRAARRLSPLPLKVPFVHLGPSERREHVRVLDEGPGFVGLRRWGGPVRVHARNVRVPWFHGGGVNAALLHLVPRRRRRCGELVLLLFCHHP